MTIDSIARCSCFQRAFSKSQEFQWSVNRPGGGSPLQPLSRRCSSKAQGVNVSLVANLPVTDAFNVFAKGGTTYAWTEQTAAPATVATGKENGFGVSYGAGLGYDITRNVQVVGEWDRNRFNFVSGRENGDMFSAGVKFKF